MDKNGADLFTVQIVWHLEERVCCFYIVFMVRHLGSLGEIGRQERDTDNRSVQEDNQEFERCH